MEKGKEMDEIFVGNRKCTLLGDTGALHLDAIFLLGTHADEDPDKLVRIAALIKEAEPGKTFLIAAYTVEDWLRDYSPWPAEAEGFPGGFGGQGPVTRDYVLNDLIPYLRQRTGLLSNADPIPFYALGYSLAGLFSLYLLYESEEIKGAACCSGSLFFPGWREYADARNERFARKCSQCVPIVYLSLGGKETHTKNTLMAGNGERVKEEEQRLKKAGVKVKFEWNAGGHFADSAPRIAKGAAWLLHNA